ncbi:hypothetical protein [Caproicibacter fermentans]|nr:hypothetical protein [Caproicibacter fermentans]
MIYTIFPAEPDEMPQDFSTEREAKEYAAVKGLDGYTIESTTGDVE